MNEFPLKNPQPDFNQFRKVLLGEAKPGKVHLSELLIDFEVVGAIYEQYFGKKMIPLTKVFSKYEIGKRLLYLGLGRGLLPMCGRTEQQFVKQLIEFNYRMGYDYVHDCLPGLYAIFMMLPKGRMTSDTAQLNRGQRWWIEETRGVITSWKDFNKFPWKRLRVNFSLWYEFWAKNLPPGMKITFQGMLYELVSGFLLGPEGLYLMLHDQPDLVEAVFNRMGEIVYDFYQQAVQADFVGALFHTDDMGYKNGTMIRPDDLRRLLFPWLKKYSELAHSHGKMFWLHSCGNLRQVYDELITDVKIDAYHSYQDEIMPVGEFQKQYSGRVASLGGVDVDKLARLEEEPLRKYCRKVLDDCMPHGRYAFGSGNSVTNYVPVKNYLIMLDEARNWRA